MVATYNIAGMKVGSHVLAMITLGTIFAGSYLSTAGGDKKAQTKPTIQASSKEEENFIQNFIREAEKEEKKAKH